MPIRRKIYINLSLCLALVLLSYYFIYPLILNNEAWVKKNKQSTLMLARISEQQEILQKTSVPLQATLKKQADYFNHVTLSNFTHGKKEWVHHLTVQHESATFELSFDELLSLIDTYPFPIEFIKAKSQGKMIRLTVGFFIFLETD